MNYLVYTKLINELEKHYLKLIKEIEDKLSRQMDPFLVQYDQDIEQLNKEFEEVEKSLSLEEKKQKMQEMFQLKKDRCFRLFDDLQDFVDRHDTMLKLLNKKMREAKELVRDVYLKENSTIDE